MRLLSATTVAGTIATLVIANASTCAAHPVNSPRADAPRGRGRTMAVYSALLTLRSLQSVPSRVCLHTHVGCAMADVSDTRHEPPPGQQVKSVHGTCRSVTDSSGPDTPSACRCDGAGAPPARHPPCRGEKKSSVGCTTDENSSGSGDACASAAVPFTSDSVSTDTNHSPSPSPPSSHSRERGVADSVVTARAQSAALVLVCAHTRARALARTLPRAVAEPLVSKRRRRGRRVASQPEPQHRQQGAGVCPAQSRERRRACHARTRPHTPACPHAPARARTHRPW